jgi:Uma2 family endonuclease
VTPAPNTAHQIIANRIQSRLTAAVQWTGAGYVSDRASSTSIWLAVEMLSRSSKIYDRDCKKDAYFALGVRQVWLVDR